jgi:hypothetical protein
MDRAGQVIGGPGEPGGGGGRGRGWLAGFLLGVGVGTGVALIFWALSRSTQASHVEVASRVSADGSVELVYKVWIRPV